MFSFSLKVKSGSSAGGCDEALEMTVYDYFVKHRHIELKSSSYMPCLDVGKPKRPIYLPLEVQNFSLVILWNLYLLIKKLNPGFSLGIPAMFSSLSPEIHKSIISISEISLNWKIKAEATRENSSCNRCNVLLMHYFSSFLYSMAGFIFPLNLFRLWKTTTMMKIHSLSLVVYQLIRSLLE